MTSFINAQSGEGTGNLLSSILSKLLRESPDRLIYWSFSGGDIYFDLNEVRDEENGRIISVILKGKTIGKNGFERSSRHLTLFAYPDAINPAVPSIDFLDIYPYLSSQTEINIHSCGYVYMSN